MPVVTNTTANVTTILDECQAVIGYHFQKPELLRAALTHTSGANTRAASNERLEFLGDSVLGLATCQLLFDEFPQYEEGDMTKVKSVVVSRKTCAQFSRALGLGDFMFLGKGLNEIPDNLHADVFEALVAAIFIDGGWDEARDFVLDFIRPEVERVANDAVNNNVKSRFQQVAQKQFGGTPLYVLLDEGGPEHHRSFKVAARVNEYQFPAAWGRPKKEAELRAALNALAAIENEEIPHPCE